MRTSKARLGNWDASAANFSSGRNKQDIFSRCCKSVIEDEIHDRDHDGASLRVYVEADADQDHGNRHTDGAEDQAFPAADLLDEQDWSE